MRILLTLVVVLLLPAGLLADKNKGNNTKPNHAAEINILEQKKRELQGQEKAQMNQIETQFRAGLDELQRQKSQMERAHRDKLEAEKHQTLKRVDERYAYVLKYEQPREVWGQLDHDAKVLRAVHHHLVRANFDYAGRRVAAIKSLDVAVRSLENRLTVHRWNVAEKEATVLELAAAEVDLQQALAFAVRMWGPGTPAGMPESQIKSNQQLATGLTTIDNVRHLIRYAQWEEKVDAAWKDRVKKHEAEERQKVRAAYDARLKGVDKEVSQHLESRKKELGQKKQQATAQTKAQYHAVIVQIDSQINRLRK